jgi:uncharacterized protein YndB with AHSA1/START domain
MSAVQAGRASGRRPRDRESGDDQQEKQANPHHRYGRASGSAVSGETRRSGGAHTIADVPRTDRASRLIAAPRDRVYTALVDPEALRAWLPPAGMTGRFERFDPRPGGSYRLVLTYADASESRGKATADTDIVESRFVDLVPGARVVQAVDFVTDDPAYAGTMTMTWELTEVDGGTRVEIVADHVPNGIDAKDHAAGLGSSLANLAAYLEG